MRGAMLASLFVGSLLDPNSPQSFLGDDLQMQWWPGKSAQSLGGGSVLTSITDDVQGLTLEQLITGAKPIYEPTGYAGKPDMLSDGSDDIVRRGGTFSLTSEFDIWMAYQCTKDPAVVGTDRVFCIGGTGSSTSTIELRRAIVGGVNRVGVTVPYAGAGVQLAGLTGANTDISVPSAIRLMCRNGGFYLECNGTRSALQAGTGTPTLGNARISFGGNNATVPAQFSLGRGAYIGVTKPLADGSDKANAMYNFMTALRTP